MQSEITQTAKQIKLKVSKGEVVSEINQSAEEVKIKGEKISLEGTVTANENFKVLQDGSIQAKSGTFEGAIVSSSANITGGSINISTDEEYRSVISLRYQNRRSHFTPSGMEIVDGSAYGMFRADLMILRAASSQNVFYVSENGCDIYEDTYVNGTLKVTGTKSRLAKTKSYNDRLLYCYEMPSPIFGDVGHGVIGDDGLCYVDIDQIFFETVDMQQSYQVFLQSYAESNVYVIEKQPQYFVVKGLPNTEFDWELKAKQLDFPIERLEEKLSEDDYEETDYVALASAYLNEYEQEVLSYE